MLSPYPDDPTFPRISENHSLYPLAAWAYHHAAELPAEPRFGFYLSLSRAWDRPRGRKKTRHERGLLFTVLLNCGVPSRRIAEKWRVKSGDVTDDARDFRHHAWSPKERCVIVDDDVSSPHVAAEPYDPSTIEGQVSARGLKPGITQNFRLADELASELGYESAIMMHIEKVGRGR